MQLFPLSLVVYLNLNCVVHLLLLSLFYLIFMLTSIVFRDLSKNHIFRIDNGAFSNTVALETL